MRRPTILVALAALMLFAGACSSSDSAVENDDSSVPETTVVDDSGADSTDSDSDETPTPTTAAQASSAQTAMVTLDNGEVFEFSALCWLEVQESAGSEILFTVLSYDDPVNLDVTQFGADSFNGAANISLYDSTSYDTIWDANSLYGTDIELSLSGSTVTGSGDFYPTGDITATPVRGELVASC